MIGLAPGGGGYKPFALRHVGTIYPRRVDADQDFIRLRCRHRGRTDRQDFRSACGGRGDVTHGGWQHGAIVPLVPCDETAAGPAAGARAEPGRWGDQAGRDGPARNRSTGARRDRKGPFRQPVATQRAVERYESIPHQLVREDAAALAERGRQRVTLHVLGQGHELVRIRGHAAVAQIGDACAAGPRQRREWRGVRAQLEHVVEAIAAALERCAVVRGAEREQLPQRTAPAMPLAGAVMDRTACDEPAHAVADQRQLLERYRPVRNQRLQQCRERASIRVNRAAAVVTEKQQGLPALACDLRQPVLAGTTPVLLVEAQPVNRNHDPAGRARHHARGLRGIHRHAMAQQGHGQRQRVRREFEVIAIHAVECRYPCIARCSGFTRGQQRTQGTESGVEPFAYHPRGAANAAVDQAGDSARGFCARCA